MITALLMQVTLNYIHDAGDSDDFMSDAVESDYCISDAGDSDDSTSDAGDRKVESFSCIRQIKMSEGICLLKLSPPSI